MFYKKVMFLYLKILILLIVILTSVICVSDPYMLFHDHWFDKGKIYSNFRIQNYGLIKFKDFDSIILGTSMLENTSAKEASEKLKGNYVNLSISGASFYERFLVLMFALRTKKIKNVIISLDYHFNTEQKINETFEPNLYSSLPLKSKIKIYSTNKALKNIFKRQESDFIEENLDRPNAWYQREWHDRRFGGFQNWVKHYNEDEQIQDAFNLLLKGNKNYSENMPYQEIIDNEILPLFEHKETSFSIIIPPYSVLWWASGKDVIKDMMKPFEYLILNSASYPNVKIYWFYDDPFVSDISMYKDLTHYYYTVNSLQLDALQKGTHIIDTENYQQKFTSFINKINKFNIEPYIRKVKEVIKNNKENKG